MAVALTSTCYTCNQSRNFCECPQEVRNAQDRRAREFERSQSGMRAPGECGGPTDGVRCAGDSYDDGRTAYPDTFGQGGTGLSGVIVGFSPPNNPGSPF